MKELLLVPAPSLYEYYTGLLSQAEMIQKLAELGAVEHIVPEGFPGLDPIHVLGARLTAVQKQIKDWQQRLERMSERHGLAGDPFRMEGNTSLVGIRKTLLNYMTEEAKLLDWLSENVELDGEHDSV